MTHWGYLLIENAESGDLTDAEVLGGAVAIDRVAAENLARAALRAALQTGTGDPLRLEAVVYYDFEPVTSLSPRLLHSWS